MRGPDRYLAAIVRLLPSTRRHWGRAMQAELAALDHDSDCWRFVLGCTRAALLPLARDGAVWQPLAATAGAAVVVTGEIVLAGAIGQTVPLLLVLALLAWLGRRPGYLGPLRRDRTARVVRTGGYLLVTGYLVALIAGDGYGFLQPNHANWGPVFALMPTLFTVLFLALTARGTRFDSVALAAGVGGGLVAGLAAFAAMPFQQGSTTLADGLPVSGAWLMILALAVPGVVALVTRAHTHREEEVARAALCAAAIAALAVALLGFAAIVLFPRSLDEARAIMLPGASNAELRAEQDIGASDTYAGVLMLAGMLAAVLWVTTRSLRPGTTSVLLALLAAPPALFGIAVVGSNPGAAAVLFAAAAFTLAMASAIKAAARATEPDAAGSS
ncbi:MAG: hypothetical protein QOD65_3529 [Gaiellales bacterium]|nr:hypothetical protein [Gaiellales bacterium]